MRLEIQGMADGLQTPTEAAHHLTQELGEVSDLVADLIFLASADTAPQLQMDWLDINNLVGSAVKRFEGAATQQKNLNLRFIPQVDLPGICGDVYHLQRAVSNLLSNAIRHTPSNGNITVHTQRIDGKIEITVEDTGEGIPAEHLAHVFERFYRVDSSRNRQSGGRGLGLAIVKQVAEQHGGEVRVNSIPGQGSNFVLRLPIQDSPI
jgi:signal transduction histidine kinase